MLEDVVRYLDDSGNTADSNSRRADMGDSDSESNDSTTVGAAGTYDHPGVVNTFNDGRHK
jgi:hypothetical protein